MTVTVDRREAQDAQASERLAIVDPEVWAAMVGERDRQAWKIELIASENYVSAAVLEAQGSWLTNKYAEGQPGKRYYGGCEYVDIVETLAEERAIALFPGAEHVNVQPHSGAQANMAAYLSVLDHGDRVLGMSLAHGGHLTHGSPVNFSGRWFEIHAYGVTPHDERIDYDALAIQAAEVRPKLIVAGASAYPRIIDFERLAAIARANDALLMVDMAHIAGLVAAGLHPSPFPHADIVTTTTHKTLRGPRGGLVFGRADLAAAIDKAVFPGTQGGPLMHVIAAKAVALLEASTAAFRDDQSRTIANASTLARTLADAGARLVSGGTDNHLLLVDVTPFGVTGKEAERLLDDVGITVNKNAIPFDPLPPNTASGIRVGSPAVTTRGFGPVEMERVGLLIVRALRGRDDPSLLAELAREVRDICARFPGTGVAGGVNLDFEELPFIVVAFIAAVAAAYFLTPVAMRFATRTGAIDQPDEGRRVHVLPVPRAGGLAVAVAFIGVVLAALFVNDQLDIIDTTPPSRGGVIDPAGLPALTVLLGGAALAALFGFIDDRWQIRARWQFLLQLVLAGLAIALGVTITSINNPLEFLGGVFSPDTLEFTGAVAAGVTAIWVIGMINSINFIDGLDGLSTGVSLIAAITLGIISLTIGQYQPMVALLCAILAGSLAGFLPWNFHPARVFIGTTGVFVAGYALAILSILGYAKITVALLVLGVPIIDTFWIITRRLAAGSSPFTPDRGHIHHRLLDLGLTHRGAVLLIYAICTLLAIASLMLTGSGPLYAFMGIVVGFGLVLYLITRRAGGDGALEASSYPDDDIEPEDQGGGQRSEATALRDDRPGRVGRDPA